jgi:AcrR family transcriptional regulator
MLHQVGIVLRVSAISPRPSAEDALRLGRRRFQAGERLDMSAVADALGINRVTLYRWFGSRDRFVVEVLWSLASQALAAVNADVTARGPERIVELVSGFLELIIANAGMQHWLADEGEHAMRLLTRHETDFQPRLIAAIESALRDEAEAYVMVRLIESYTYLDLITGEQPDARRAEPILRMLLRLDAERSR